MSGLEGARGEELGGAFERAAEPHRRELQVHCYRILGSLHEAEDALQETMLRAWRAFGSFEGRSSVRSWLYRIATNVCLNALAKRSNSRRLLPALHGSPSLELPADEPAQPELVWIEPYPDADLEGIVDTMPGPYARYEQREATRLAFIAAIQHLPGRQRAIVLLHDVVGWSPTETGAILDMSVAAVNSALQRARATLRKYSDSEPRSERDISTARQRALLERYVRAWETKDLDDLVAILKEDAVFSMPPGSEWYRGRDAIRALFAWVWSSFSTFRLIETSANGLPAFAVFGKRAGDAKWHECALHVLAFEDDAISAVTTFREPGLFRSFGLSARPSWIGDGEEQG